MCVIEFLSQKKYNKAKTHVGNYYMYLFLVKNLVHKASYKAAKESCKSDFAMFCFN